MKATHRCKKYVLILACVKLDEDAHVQEEGTQINRSFQTLLHVDA